MKKVLTAVSAALVLGFATMAAPTSADAGCRGCAVGAGVAAGILGAAIIGGAIANSQPAPYYAPSPGYVAYPAYGQPYPVACPGGYWARRPVYDRWGNVIGYSGRARFFCP
jgi:hypothetical protein